MLQRTLNSDSDQVANENFLLRLRVAEIEGLVLVLRSQLKAGAPRGADTTRALHVQPSIGGSRESMEQMLAGTSPPTRPLVVSSLLRFTPDEVIASFAGGERVLEFVRTRWSWHAMEEFCGQHFN
ncbi:MAG: hypothetical protein AB1714_23355 [Acidobacteriota bacterium]